LILLNQVSRLIPAGLKPLARVCLISVREIKFKARSIFYIGQGRLCPICNRNSRKFLTVGLVPRKDAQCPNCGSGERHRLAWLFFQRQTSLFEVKNEHMLHIAPESCIKTRLMQLTNVTYLTADLNDKSAMVKMDITNIQYEDNYFDIIYCSHVLEHVAEDKKAMGEFFRVLKNKTGWLCIAVPIEGGVTQEDAAITSPADRLKFYGDEDHVRVYGLDFKTRLEAAGFNVSRVEPTNILSKEEIILMGITLAAGDIYLCTKE
jgi:SAM-dependent methyltransferase